ncbi:kicstor complex protein c12orf66 [Anaeramoeba flamelloides]|uniref:Kicstor complex protein c12orf66 n=1 Tax=Anaeramoeba flamelloides TaxID=1746091 RepID=A0ABQ8Z1V6_9EUKA|nr:kicstor complex protein c12orf66 [Anaeramoeba flamelloides]
MELTKTLTIFQKFLEKQKSGSTQDLNSKLTTEYQELQKTVSSPLQLINTFSSLSLFNFAVAHQSTGQEIEFQQKRMEINKKQQKTNQKQKFENEELIILRQKLGKFLKIFCVLEQELKQKSTKLVEKIKSIHSKSHWNQKIKRKTENNHHKSVNKGKSKKSYLIEKRKITNKSQANLTQKQGSQNTEFKKEEFNLDQNKLTKKKEEEEEKKKKNKSKFNKNQKNNKKKKRKWQGKGKGKKRSNVHENEQKKEPSREKELSFLRNLFIDFEHLIDIRLEMLSFYKKLANFGKKEVYDVDYKRILNKLTRICSMFLGKIEHTLILKIEENCIFEVGIMMNLFGVQYLFKKFDLVTTLLAMFNAKELILKWKLKLNKQMNFIQVDSRNKNEINMGQIQQNNNNSDNNYNFQSSNLNYDNKNIKIGNNNNQNNNNNNNNNQNTNQNRLSKKSNKRRKKIRIRRFSLKNRKMISIPTKKRRTVTQVDENENYTLVDWCSEFYESLVNKISIYYITPLRKSYNNSYLDRESWMKQQKDRTDIFLNFNTFFTRNGAYWIALVLNDVDQNNINTNQLRNGYKCDHKKQKSSKNQYGNIFSSRSSSEESFSGGVQYSSSDQNEFYDDNYDMNDDGDGAGDEVVDDDENDGNGNGNGNNHNKNDIKNNSLSKSKIKISFDKDIKNSKQMHREQSFRSKITKKYFCIFSFPTESRNTNTDYPIMINLLDESIGKLRKSDKPIYYYDKKRSMTLWFAQVEQNITLIVEFKKKKNSKDKNTLNFIYKTIQQLRNINLYKKFVNNY